MNFEIKGFLPVIGIVFIVLKLFAVISWSWWWVCSPFLIIPVLVLIQVTLVVYLVNRAKKKGRW